MFGEVKGYWAWMLAVGVFFVALGIAGLLMLPLVATLTAVLFGALAIAAGVFQLINGLKHTSGWVSKLANIILALIYIVFGVLTFYDPMLGVAAITFALAVSLMAMGVLRAWIAWQNRDALPSWGWWFASGVASLILGALLAVAWPAASPFFLGLYVSLDLLFSGATFVALALAARA